MIPNQIQPPPPPVEVDDDIEYEIAKILDSKLDKNARNADLSTWYNGRVMRVQTRR